MNIDQISLHLVVHLNLILNLALQLYCLLKFLHLVHVFLQIN